RAVEAARKSQPKFARMTAFERSKLCHAIAAEIRKHQVPLARYLTLEQGKPYHAEALGEVEVAAQIFDMAAEEIVRLNGEIMPSADASKRVLVLRQPRGVYGVITPWNFPFAIPAQYLAYGLAAGNTIVWVP